MEYRAQLVAPGMLRLITNKQPEITEGEYVLVDIEKHRSDASHNHQFAWIENAWRTLPETVMFEEWAATPETLRKHALIKCGYYEQVVLDCTAADVAKRVSKEIEDARKKAHGYAVGVVRGSIAIIRWPESQSRKAMGATRFQESKTAILEWIAAQIGVSPEDLRKNAAGDRHGVRWSNGVDA